MSELDLAQLLPIPSRMEQGGQPDGDETESSTESPINARTFERSCRFTYGAAPASPLEDHGVYVQSNPFPGDDSAASFRSRSSRHEQAIAFPSSSVSHFRVTLQ